mmetsp:Transcript_6711/g.5842  ORF Transcript_6711/g.5842 Transcript_6711/m.5842 type:complete len:115 (+) Transcript_6711:375-719(+)|eukprot:CAMPEP_0205802392 /NCGR_PEP_ID=MMETSP0205-20121125/4685_1 /ASSEMBLY_ACC=CAM_ASM_000278 /TAXON_ID=36767 /ORGANISM="Euplotes focardii, Strain TN1" /LENGTH=114 /DNA_ID=CAMNT_0053068703 /DNA_START=312 /DNA_END=656 /DNA_ORIENTATION=+
MIIDKSRIISNLNDVDLYMFDDKDIQAEIEELKQELDNDQTIIDASIDNSQDFSYPLIKNRFDDADVENIPHHLKSIDPLHYHLMVWAVIRLSILEMIDEDNGSDHNIKLIIHK